MAVTVHVKRDTEPGMVVVWVADDYGAASGPEITECKMTLAQAIRFNADLMRVINDTAAMLP